MIRTIPPVDVNALEQGLRRLKLRHIRENLEDVNEVALQEEPSYLDFLGYMVEQEVRGRESTQREKRLTAARFPFYKTIDDFNFRFQNSVSQQTLRNLAQLKFLEARENIILVGPPGVGKTHLAVALGVAAVNVGHRVLFTTAQDLVDQLYSALADGTVAQKLKRLLRHDLIILDEVGYLQLDTTGSDHLFQVVAKAYERRSLIVTSNLDFQEWGQLFDQPATAAAVLDRLLHHAHVISLKGDSYRMRHRLAPPAPSPNHGDRDDVSSSLPVR
jgi:DNA replication protein DnaC